MPGMNLAVVGGNIGGDPDIRNTQGGDKIASFSVATSERWTDKRSGELKEKTEWHRIVVFNERLVEIVEKYLRKGSRVIVRGKLATREWQDKDGVKRYTTEIVVGRFDGEITLMGDAGGGAGGRPAQGQGERDAAREETRAAPRGHAHNDLDDDIPF